MRLSTCLMILALLLISNSDLVEYQLGFGNLSLNYLGLNEPRDSFTSR
ncbi:MAG: hypothetical protein ACK5P7_03260 [Bdellovibrio sp.]